MGLCTPTLISCMTNGEGGDAATNGRTSLPVTSLFLWKIHAATGVRIEGHGPGRNASGASDLTLTVRVEPLEYNEYIQVLLPCRGQWSHVLWGVLGTDCCGWFTGNALYMSVFVSDFKRLCQQTDVFTFIYRIKVDLAALLKLLLCKSSVIPLGNVYIN